MFWSDALKRSPMRATPLTALYKITIHHLQYVWFRVFACSGTIAVNSRRVRARHGDTEQYVCTIHVLIHKHIPDSTPHTYKTE